MGGSANPFRGRVRDNVPMLRVSQGQHLVRGRTAPIRVWLILAGIALCTATNVLANRAMRGDPDNPRSGDLLASQLPPLVVNLGRAGLAMVLAGGILCAVAPAGRRVPRRYRVLLYCSIGYSLILAGRNLPPGDFLTYSVTPAFNQVVFMLSKQL
jgi:hypothetical protein